MDGGPDIKLCGLFDRRKVACMLRLLLEEADKRSASGEYEWDVIERVSRAECGTDLGA
jgi:hypothetical protein